METEPAKLICKHCGNETPPASLCAVCSRPLPRPPAANRAVLIVAIAIILVAVGILVVMAGSAPS